MRHNNVHAIVYSDSTTYILNWIGHMNYFGKYDQHFITETTRGNGLWHKNALHFNNKSGNLFMVRDGKNCPMVCKILDVINYKNIYYLVADIIQKENGILVKLEYIVK